MSQKKTRVLIVGAFPEAGTKVFGGVVTACRTLEESSFFDRYDVVKLDSTQISNPPPGVVVRSVFALVRVMKFIYLLLTKRPEAVILFTSLGGSVMEKGAMGWLAKLVGTPSLLFPRGAGVIQSMNQSAIRRMIYGFFLRGGAYFLCQGPVWQSFAINTLGYRADRTAIIHNWTATDDLLRIGMDRQLSTHKSLVTLLFVGWLEREKGIFELLSACDALDSQLDFKLLIAGRGHAEDEARAFVESSDRLSNCVEFLGWLKGDALGMAYRDSDVLVLPSWHEGFPNVIIEAMAARLGVIVTSVGSIPGVISDHEQALLIQPKNVEVLRGALHELLNDRGLLHFIANQGHEFAKNNFAAETAADKLTAVVDRSIAKH